MSGFTGFFVFSFFLVAITVIFIITYPFDEYRKIPNKALKGLAWSVLKPIPTWSFEIKNADVNKICKPTLIVSNHQSFLDMPLLYLLPWSMKWVAKESLLRIPFLGWLIAMTGHVMIDRKSRQSFKKMNELVEPIKSGIPGMIFPEGTRTRDGSLQYFRSGAFALASKYNFNILPVAHNGGYGAMPGGSWKFSFHQHFAVSVLEPVDPDDFEDASELKDEVHRQISEALNNMKSQ